MVTENTIQDVEEQSPETPDKLDLLLAEIKGIKDTQGKLENRLGFALRKLDGQPEGRSDPALVSQVAQIQKELESQRVAMMSDEERAEHYRAQADIAERKAAQGVAPIPEDRLKILFANKYEGEVMPVLEEWCQDAGIDLTPARQKHLSTFQLPINMYTADVDATGFLKKAFEYLRGDHKAQLDAAKRTTPADDAGPTLGDGTRSAGGSRQKLPTWEEAHKLAQAGELSDEMLAKLVAAR